MAQRFQDFEVVIVDDGSTDNSIDIIKKILNDALNISVISQTNKGVSAARNAGLSCARGQYIWFVDPDDWISYNALDVLFSHIADLPEIVYFSNWHYIEDEELLRPNQVTSLDVKDYDKKQFFANHEFETVPWLYLFKKSFLDTNNIKFHVDINIHEDDFFIQEAFACVNRIRMIPDQLYYYRMRSNSLTRSDRHADRMFSLARLILLNDQLRYSDPEFADVYNSRLYNLKNKYYSLLHTLSVQGLKKNIPLELHKQVHTVKFKTTRKDVMGIRAMKWLHNYVFPLYYKKLTKL